MGMLERLTDAHPDVVIVAYDGHYRRIHDNEMHILSHIEVSIGSRSTTMSAVERERRKKLKPKAVEARLSSLITRFKQAA